VQVNVEKRGASEELDALIAELRPALIRYFSRRLLPQHEVEDLVHDVLVRLVRNKDFAGAESARGYVFQTANSVLVDYVRRRARSRAEQHTSFDVDALVGEVLGPERVLQGKEELVRITAVLMEFPELTRTIFVLRRIEGMKYKDIAVRLGLSLSAVEKHMRRAVACLLERLESP
jgi:RNA polymerase sigma factor (sigma-70 family)